MNLSKICDIFTETTTGNNLEGPSIAEINKGEFSYDFRQLPGNKERSSFIFSFLLIHGNIFYDFEHSVLGMVNVCPDTRFYRIDVSFEISF